MKLFFLFFLLYASLYEKSFQDNVLCKQRTDQVVPNVLKAYHSVDITELDIFTQNSPNQGIHSEVFNCSVNSQRYWHNPIIPSSKYMVPDEIPRIYLDSFGEFSERVTIHKDMDSLMTSLSINAGVSVDAQAYGQYSLSGAFKTAKENILKNDCTIVEITAVVSSYAVEIVPYVSLNISDSFQRELDTLRGTYEKHSSPYTLFLQRYGTHYFSSLRLGGLVIMSTVVKNSYLQSSNSNEFFTKVGASFKKFVGVNMAFNGSTSETSIETSSDISHSIRVYGGDDEAVKEGIKSIEEFNKWLITVQKRPFTFGGKLVPITNLVRNAEVREQLKIAINAKLNNAFLDNMQATLNMIGHGGHKIVSKIEYCLKELIPKSSDMEEIKATVDELTKNYLLKRDRVGSRTADAFNNFDMEKLLELQVRGTISKAINSK